jgi:cytochrome b
VIRIGHWTLVVAFFTAYAAGDRFGPLHEWAGYLIGVVIGIRLVWGFVGPVHARFGSFVQGPAATVRYLTAMARRCEPRYLGHNPAGAVMICALLCALAGIVGSGLVLQAAGEGQEADGVRAAAVSGTASDGGAEAQRADMAVARLAKPNDARLQPGAGATRHERVEALHVFFVDVVLLLVSLHIAGVLYAGHVHGEDLIGAMFSGRKPLRRGGGQDG